MRLVLLLSTLMIFSGCGTTDLTQAPDASNPSSLMGSQGGGGIATDIWSNNPSQKTWTNENPAYGP